MQAIAAGLVIFATMLCGSSPAMADSPPAVDPSMPMSLSHMVEAMQKNNPQLQQSRHNYDAAKQVAPQILAPNNPMFGFVNDQMKNHPLNFGASQQFYYTITQSFPFPGKKRLAANIADDQAAIVNTQTEGLYQQLLSQLRTTYYQFLTLQKQFEINKDNILRLEQIKQISRVRYANRSAAYVDYLNASVAQSSAEADQFNLQKQIDTMRVTLNNIMGRNPDSPLPLAGEIVPQQLPKTALPGIENLAIENSPFVKGSRIQVQAAQKGVSLAKLAYYPDFQIVGYFNSENPPIGMGNVGTYGLELDIVVPLWFFMKEKAGVKQADSLLKASEANEDAMRKQIRFNVNAAYNALAQSINQSLFIRNRQLVEAKTSYRLAVTNYAEGNMAFIDVLTAQTSLRTAELALVQSENNAIQAYANLVAVVGKDVE